MIYLFPFAAYGSFLVLFLLPCNICAQAPTRLAKIKNPPATKNGISYPSVAEKITPTMNGPSKAPAREIEFILDRIYFKDCPLRSYFITNAPLVS